MKLFIFYILIFSTNLLTSFSMMNKGSAKINTNAVMRPNKLVFAEDEPNGSFQFPSGLLQFN